MKITENVELSELSYMKIGGQSKYLIEVEKEEELNKITEIKEEEKIPIFILGEGSNTLFSDDFHNKAFIKISIKEIVKTYTGPGEVNVEVGAGVNWDDFVAWTVKNKLSGIETLSGIPGTVGAAPIQNIGAYGSEVSDVITHVRVFSLDDNEFYEVSNEEAKFGYRDSVFKQNIGKFIITKVSFQLSKKKPNMPTYRDLSLHFLKERNTEPTLKEIRNAVLDIRGSKLPDPKTDPNCGSFFKNPIIINEVAKKLAKKFPDMPQFKVSNDEVKVSGGWLIEKSGFKGKDFGNIRVSKKSALVLISNGKAKLKDLEGVMDTIIRGVEKNFGVRLEIEPNIVY